MTNRVFFQLSRWIPHPETSCALTSQNFPPLLSFEKLWSELCREARQLGGCGFHRRKVEPLFNYYVFSAKNGQKMSYLAQEATSKISPEFSDLAHSRINLAPLKSWKWFVNGLFITTSTPPPPKSVNTRDDNRDDDDTYLVFTQGLLATSLSNLPHKCFLSDSCKSLHHNDWFPSLSFRNLSCCLG